MTKLAAILVCATSVASLPACVGGDDYHLEGDHYHYVVSELRIPHNSTTAREDSLDLDGDRAVDNELGQVFGALAGTGLGVGDTAHEALLRGGIIMLADLETSSFDSTPLSGFTTYLGADPVPAPCLDPTQLATCGQHLTGTGTFSVDASSISEQGVSPIVDGVYNDLLGVMPVEIAIDPSSPIRLDLHASRVRLTHIAEDHISAILAGGITQADIDGVVVPAAAAQMDRIVRRDCPQASPCTCADGSSGKLLQDYFDADHDCRITVTELAANTIVQSLLSTDITVHGEKLMSFGVGVELATATFAPP